jgi:hypothetical protein
VGVVMSGRLGELVAAQDRVAKLIWAAMCGALFVYAAVPLAMSASWQQPGDAELASLMPYLGGLAVLIAAASFVYRRREFSDDKLRSLLREPTSVEALARQVPSADERRRIETALEAMSAEERRVYGVVISRVTPTIVVLALQEAVGLVGLVAAFLLRDATVVFPFVGVALLLHIGVFPRTTALAERVQKLGLTVPVTT